MKRNGIFKACLTCKINFYVSKSRFHLKYCSYACSNKSELRRLTAIANLPKDVKDENNGRWRGSEVGYHALHNWVDKHKQKNGQCEACDKRGRTTWANISHEYKRDVNDYIEACYSCNSTYDVRSGHWGTARTKFPEIKPKMAFEVI